MAYLYSTGYAVVESNQDPNSIELLQSNHQIKIAVNETGDKMWKFVSSNPDGSKWVLNTVEETQLPTNVAYTNVNNNFTADQTILNSSPEIKLKNTNSTANYNTRIRSNYASNNAFDILQGDGLHNILTSSYNAGNIHIGKSGSRIAIGRSTIDGGLTDTLQVFGTTKSNYFISTQVDTNTAVATDNLKVSGFGIMGNRGAIYVTNNNSQGSVRLGVGGVHSQGKQAIFESNGDFKADNFIGNWNGNTLADFNAKYDKSGGTISGNVLISSTSSTTDVSVFDAAVLKLGVGSNPQDNIGITTIAMPYSSTNGYGITLNANRTTVGRGYFSLRNHLADDIGTEIFKVDHLGEVTATNFIGGGSQLTNVNAVTLGGFNSSRYAKRINLSGQLQTTSYRKSVIGLVELTNSNTSATKWASGKIVMKRSNGAAGLFEVSFRAQKLYNTEIMQLGYSFNTISNYKDNFIPCVFTYNGKKYGGFYVYLQAANHDITVFEGEGSDDIFALDYYTVNTNTVLNSEVNDSIDFTTTDNYSLLDTFKVNDEIIYHTGNDDNLAKFNTDVTFKSVNVHPNSGNAIIELKGANSENFKLIGRTDDIFTIQTSEGNVFNLSKFGELDVRGVTIDTNTTTDRGFRRNINISTSWARPLASFYNKYYDNDERFEIGLYGGSDYEYAFIGFNTWNSGSNFRVYKNGSITSPALKVSSAGAYSNLEVQRNTSGANVGMTFQNASYSYYFGVDVTLGKFGFVNSAGAGIQNSKILLSTNTGDISSEGNLDVSGTGTFGSLKIANTFSALVMEETDQTGANGLYRLESSSNSFAIARNTSDNRDFSTRTFPFKLNSDNSAVFAEKITSQKYVVAAGFSGGFFRGSFDNTGYNLMMRSGGTNDAALYVQRPETGAGTMIARFLHDSANSANSGISSLDILSDKVLVGADLEVSNVKPTLTLNGTQSSTSNLPTIRFKDNTNQGVKLVYTPYDSTLQEAGYGLILTGDDDNTQFGTTGKVQLTVLGEIYAGSETMSTTHKLFHGGNFLKGTDYAGINNVNTFTERQIISVSNASESPSLTIYGVNTDNRHSYLSLQTAGGIWAVSNGLSTGTTDSNFYIKRGTGGAARRFGIHRDLSEFYFYNTSNTLGITLRPDGTSEFKSSALRIGTTNMFQFSQNLLQGLGTNGALIRSAISTATNPSFSNSDDSDTGMYLSGNNTLGLTTGGVARYVISSSGLHSMYGTLFLDDDLFVNNGTVVADAVTITSLLTLGTSVDINMQLQHSGGGPPGPPQYVTLNTNDDGFYINGTLTLQNKLITTNSSDDILLGDGTYASLAGVLASASGGEKYTWATEGDRTSQGGMAEGDMGVVTATRKKYRYESGSWVFMYDLDSAHTHSFNELTSKPTTLNGYGIQNSEISAITDTLGYFKTNGSTPLTGNLVFSSSSNSKTVRFGSGTGSKTIDLPTNSGTLALTSQLPTLTSQLTNNSDFVTSSQIANFATLNGDSGQHFETSELQLGNWKLKSVGNELCIYEGANLKAKITTGGVIKATNFNMDI